MKVRFSPAANPEAYRAMLGLESYLSKSSIEKPLQHLIKLRRFADQRLRVLHRYALERPARWAKPSNGCMAWMRGERARTTPIANVPRSNGRNRSR